MKKVKQTPSSSKQITSTWCHIFFGCGLWPGRIAQMPHLHSSRGRDYIFYKYCRRLYEFVCILQDTECLSRCHYYSKDAPYWPFCHLQAMI